MARKHTPKIDEQGQQVLPPVVSVDGLTLSLPAPRNGLPQPANSSSATSAVRKPDEATREPIEARQFDDGRIGDPSNKNGPRVTTTIKLPDMAEIVFAFMEDPQHADPRRTAIIRMYQRFQDDNRPKVAKAYVWVKILAKCRGIAGIGMAALGLACGTLHIAWRLMHGLPPLG